MTLKLTASVYNRIIENNSKDGVRERAARILHRIKKSKNSIWVGCRLYNSVIINIIVTSKK